METAKKTQPDDWKDKYFKALNEFDLEGRRRGEQLARVSRDLLGVLEQFRGADPAFDGELAALVRSRQLDHDTDQARLRELVGKVSRKQESVAVAPAAAHSQLPAAAGNPKATLRTLVGAIAGPAAAQAALTELKTYLDRAMAEADEIDAVAAVAAKLSAIISGIGTGQALAARDTLQTLVDHLSLPEAAQARLAALTSRLQHAAEEPAVRGIAKDIAVFLVDYVGSMQTDLAGLNGFLVVIKSRLGEVSGFLVSEGSERDVAASARADLNTAMGRTLSSMRDQVADATSLERLKLDIQTQLALIDGNVTTFMKSEADRSAQLETQREALVRQLDELEGQSETLRRKLADAEALAARDSLTGLPNRLAYNDRMRLEYGRWQRDGRPLSLAVLDIDRFKSINDTFGHPAGDRVLKHLARELGSEIRAQDFFGRYGGEEFVLILPDTARAGALRLVDKLRQHIEACRFKFKDAPVNVTFSCGVAEFQSGEAIETVLARADAGLYAAKRNGRNRVEALA